MLEMVVIYAHWCPICNMMMPLVEEIEEDYRDKILFRRIDAEESPEVLEKYEILIVPTFIIYSERKELARMAGMIGESAFRTRLEVLMKGEQ